MLDVRREKGEDGTFSLARAAFDGAYLWFGYVCAGKEGKEE